MAGQLTDTELEERSLASVAYERILSMILDGELRTGDQLQERRLATLMHMSRTPVREALNKLETEGLVDRQHGRLLSVREIPVRDIVEILHLRRVLESETTRLAAARLDMETLEHLRRLLLEFQQEADPDSQRHWLVDDEFHNTIAAASGNRMLLQLLQDLRLKTRIFNTRQLPKRRAPGTLEHLAILEALIERDEAKARNAMERHLENVKAAILRKLGEI